MQHSCNNTKSYFINIVTTIPFIVAPPAVLRLAVKPAPAPSSGTNTKFAPPATLRPACKPAPPCTQVLTISIFSIFRIFCESTI